MSKLTLAQASLITDAALAEGRKRKLLPLTVAVLDAGGHLVALKRDDGASLIRPQLATAKAWGTLGMGFGSRELSRRAQANPVFFNTLTALADGNMVPVHGGVLIRDGLGDIIGAVGISGDVSDADEACALAGIEAAGLTGDAG
ncbi:MAG: heme-binding protein [Aliidongia sp.]